MAIEKEEAARKAAARFSTDPHLATIEYAKMSGQLSLATLTTTEYEKLQDEMLSLLPLYRHPANNELAEHMIFFDPDCININGLGYQWPKFINNLEKKGIGEDLLTIIKKYVRESELRIIELMQCKDELSELKAKFTDAQCIFNKYRNERSDKRNALVVQTIGLSIGIVAKRVNKKNLYFDYVKLVRKEGFSRNEAAEKIRKAYGLNSHNAVCKFLYAYRKSLLERWKQQHPSLYVEIKRRLKGIIPSKQE